VLGAVESHIPEEKKKKKKKIVYYSRILESSPPESGDCDRMLLDSSANCQIPTLAGISKKIPRKSTFEYVHIFNITKP